MHALSARFSASKVRIDLQQDVGRHGFASPHVHHEFQPRAEKTVTLCVLHLVTNSVPEIENGEENDPPIAFLTRLITKE